MLEGMFCWEDDTTGCVCGNECDPPKWIVDMWNKENRLKDQYILPQEE